MEYASGGELFNYIVKKKRLDDEEACYFFYQIINGLDYIHKNNIVHRDLKPENLLLNEKKLIKIIDFGLSNQYKQSQLLETPCGSPCYAAPEMILGKKYTGILVDIWSIGIILYAMVCGFLPFEDKNNDKLYKKIIDCKLEFPSFVSELSKNFIKKLLTVNPQKRIKLEEIKEHEYYKFGEKLMNKEKVAYNKEGLKRKIFEKMKKLGFSKQEILLNLEKNKHNSITTTYHLLKKRYKKMFLLNKFEDKNEEISVEERKNTYVSKPSNDLNQNINININYLKNVGNININISDPNKQKELNNDIVGHLMQKDAEKKIE
jgi:5'-AMP-activated protein kinase catalytic alpha subunit